MHIHHEIVILTGFKQLLRMEIRFLTLSNNYCLNKDAKAENKIVLCVIATILIKKFPLENKISYNHQVLFFNPNSDIYFDVSK
jgi:hypothetical protein